MGRLTTHHLAPNDSFGVLHRYSPFASFHVHDERNNGDHEDNQANHQRERDGSPSRISRLGNQLTVAMVDPQDVFAIDNAKALTNLSVNVVIAKKRDITSAIERLYDADSSASLDEILKEIKTNDDIEIVRTNAGSMGIYHDDFPISASLTQSPGTLVSISLILFLIAVSIFSLRKAPALSTGILLFFVGHSVESTFLALEMVHEHRNYVPIVGPIFVAAFYFWHPGFTTLTTSAKWSIVFVALAVFGAVTYVRAMEWSNLVDHAAIEVHNHPDSNRTNYQMGRIYFMLYSNDKQIELAKLADKYFIRAAELGGDNVYPDVARLLIAYKARIEPDPGLIEKIAKRLRYGRPWEPNMGALNNLVNCQMTQYCKLADADMIALLLSALANPNASRKTMGTAHSLLGGYYALKLENIQQASGHIKAAVEAEPDRIEYRLDLVRLYGASGDIEAAKSELAAARKLDVWALHTQRFDAEAALLDSALKSRSG